MIDILEIIQMIGIDIEDNFDFRSQAEKTVHVFAGFRYEEIAFSDFDISVKFVQIAADQNRGVLFCIVQDERDHRSGRRLAVGAGYGDAGGIVVHESSQSFSSRDGRDTRFAGSQQLRIFPGYSGGIDYEISSGDIAGVMSFEDPDSPGSEMGRRIRKFHIGS